jgi:hypothetical protein
VAQQKALQSAKKSAGKTSERKGVKAAEDELAYRRAAVEAAAAALLDAERSLERWAAPLLLLPLPPV